MEKNQQVAHNRSSVRANYDRLSRYYDLLTGNSEERVRQMGLEWLDECPGGTALEIGCGTGRSLVRLAQAVSPGGKVYAVDLSAGMLQAARRRLQAAALQDLVELKCADALELPIESHSIDAVFTAFTLELFADDEIPLFLLECRRVMRTGSRLCVVSLSDSGRDGMMPRLYAWAHVKMPRIVDCRPIKVQEVLLAAGWRVTRRKLELLWGLPVEIVLAEVQRLP